MAQLIRLATNLKAGKNLETPDVVYKRYAGKKAGLANDTNPDSAGVIEFGRKCVNKASQIKATDKFPLIGKDGTAVFAYKGEASNVEIVGDFTGWKQKGLRFARIDKELSCFQMKFDTSARAEYKLISDGKWAIDPLNSKSIDNGVGGRNSVVEMPAYKPSEWTKDFDSTLGTGVSEFTVKSKKFGVRKVKAYVPTELFKRGIAPKLPVLYFQDGSDYIKRGKAINVLENLVSAGKVEPFMIVFIDPVERNKEYWASDDWADFMAKELVPAVEFRYFSQIKTGRDNRALLGASLGGITSIWTGIKHPDVFGRIGAQSASFWVDDERVVDALRKLQKNNSDYVFYIDDGVFEGVDDSREVVRILRDKKFDVTYAEQHTGHNWIAWKDRLAGAFIALWK